MTAVDWLIGELMHKGLMALRYDKDNTFNELIGEAKEIEKQQIIDASERLKWVDYSLVQNGEQYYNETYGDKGSGEVEFYKKELEDERNRVTSSQTEISDEEITKYVKSNNPYPSTKQGSVDWEHGFITAIEWYREQLKQRL